ncbi:hypothetical protein [Shigella phage ESh19]|nr:hypothetical protein [Shigella phage ESh19]
MASISRYLPLIRLVKYFYVRFDLIGSWCFLVMTPLLNQSAYLQTY